VSIAKRTHKFMAVMSLDVDDFKLINDNYGYAVGDKFLIEIARRIQQSLRNYDTVTRMGGMSF
jgi:diguanylate cyclase (GGDEF)-like protein